MSADKDIVATLQAALAERIGQHRYELWFGAETELEYRQDNLIIRTPNASFQNWVATHFRKDLEACCQAVLGFCPELRFEAVLRTPAGLSEPGQGPESPGRHKEAVCGDGQPTQKALPLFKEEVGKETTQLGPADEGVSASPKGEQNLFQTSPAPAVSCQQSDFPKDGKPFGPSTASPRGSTRDRLQSRVGTTSRPARRFADFDSFITGPSNQLARSSAEMVVASPGAISPLVFCGPTGVGKTHLLEATWTALRRRHPSLVSVFVSAEQFTSYYIEALRGSGMPSFRRKYRGVDVLLIDDVQFFAGKRGTQMELLYTIEALQQAGRQLIFAASAPPRELPDLLPDLAARLDSGVVCRIAPPEYETRLRLVARYAHRMGLSMPEEVCQFVANHFRQHAWELSGAVCRLHAAICATGEKLSVEFARRVLADMLAARQHLVPLTEIRKAVCEVFQIDPAGLCGPGKQRHLSYPRMLAMWLARKYSRAALSEIGQFFGGRSHSTVLSAQKQVDRWLSQGRPLRVAGTIWDPEEAIRQVEQYLRVG